MRRPPPRVTPRLLPRTLACNFDVKLFNGQINFVSLFYLTQFFSNAITPRAHFTLIILKFTSMETTLSRHEAIIWPWATREERIDRRRIGFFFFFQSPENCGEIGRAYLAIRAIKCPRMKASKVNERRRLLAVLAASIADNKTADATLFSNISHPRALAATESNLNNAQWVIISSSPSPSSSCD